MHGLLNSNRHGPDMQWHALRVPTAKHEHSGLGLEAQQASVRAFVAAQGWTLVAEHSDITSGKDDRGPGFKKRPWWSAIPLMQGKLVVGVAQLRRADQGG